MPETYIAVPVELTDAEVDAVAGGAKGGTGGNRQGAAQFGLVNAALGVQDAVKNNLNNNDVAIVVVGGDATAGD